MIDLENCGFSYPGSNIPALKNINLHIATGECVVLCGKSGCGKTTIARILNGLIPSFFPGELTGKAEVLGMSVGQTAIEQFVPVVGSVFQNPKTQHFNLDTTAELAFPCENMGMPPNEIRDRVRACAREYGLEKLLDRSIFQLSGGEKQRIAFGAACILEPKLLVLDEPTSNLDGDTIRILHDLIAKKKAQGVTIVLAEHRLAWIADVADRFCFLENGELKEQWDSAAFRQLSAQALHERGLRPLDIKECREQIAEKRKMKCPAADPVVEASDLTVGYDKKRPVYTLPRFQIGGGEIVGLMGHNGIGKSTLAKTLCGLQKPLSGSLRPMREKDRLAQSFLVMQDVNYQLFSDSVREEVLLGAKHPEECDTVLEALGLTELADRHPMSLSGGQKQRVAVASAILSGKKFVILDEPTSGLDYYHMTKTAALLTKLKERGTAVLVITHDEELAAGWCDSILYLEEPNNGMETE